MTKNITSFISVRTVRILPDRDCFPNASLSIVTLLVLNFHTIPIDNMVISICVVRDSRLINF